MLLILSNSQDGTAAQFVGFGGNVPIFRFNTDLWPDYRVTASPAGWRIEDPIGRVISDQTCSALWFRKPSAHLLPIPHGTETEQRWAMAQVQAVVDHFVSWARTRGRLLLVDPLDERRVDKLTQMSVAARHFMVPETQVSWGVPPAFDGDPVVAKSLAAAGLDGGRFLFTRRVDPTTLDARWPWYLQREYDGHDVTVVYVDGEVFAAELDRKTFDGQDWRRHIYAGGPLDWVPCELLSADKDAIRALMAELGLAFGRLDFLRAQGGPLVFLEVNTNGEWGWLDDGRRGIFAAVSKCLDRVVRPPPVEGRPIHD